MSNRPLHANGGDYATRASLIDRLQAGDPDGWGRLVSLYGPLVAHWARRAGVPSQDQDDVCQDLFRVVTKRIGTFQLGEHRGSFRAWLRNITRNVCRERARADVPALRAAGGTNAGLQLHEVADPATDEADPPELVADLHRRTLALVRGEFSPAHWQVFERLTFDGRTAAEVAAELELTTVNVRAIKSRIYRRLREELGDLLDGIA
jgi:RNA polymerase sigma-70 factor, ECF subfamily